jgi:hypothetical protein
MTRKKGIGYSRKRSSIKRVISQTNNTNAAINPDVTFNIINTPPHSTILVDDDDDQEEKTPTLEEYLMLNDSPEPVLDEKARRLAIAYMFEVNGAPEDSKEEPWSRVGDQNCLTARIRQALQLTPGYDVVSIFKNYLECQQLGKLYTGARRRQKS